MLVGGGVTYQLTVRAVRSNPYVRIGANGDCSMRSALAACRSRALNRLKPLAKAAKPKRALRLRPAMDECRDCTSPCRATVLAERGAPEGRSAARTGKLAALI